MELPSWDALFQWVSEKPEGATVGFSRDMFLGPLNLYFAETVRQSQGKYWMIGHVSASVLVWDKPAMYQEMYQKVSDVPRWIHDLINICDDLADEGHQFMGWLRPITAKMFKQALEQVKQRKASE